MSNGSYYADVPLKRSNGEVVNMHATIEVATKWSCDFYYFHTVREAGFDKPTIRAVWFGTRGRDGYGRTYRLVYDRDGRQKMPKKVRALAETENLL